MGWDWEGLDTFYRDDVQGPAEPGEVSGGHVGGAGAAAQHLFTLLEGE